MRSLNGLVLTSPISQSFLGASQNLQNWEVQHNKPQRLNSLFKAAKIDAIQRECLMIFDWSRLVDNVVKINEKTHFNKDQLNPDVPHWTQNILKEVVEINNVAQKFQQNIYKLTSHDEFKENQVSFQQRLKDASIYFQPKIDLIKSMLIAHPITCKTKKLASEFDGPFEEIAEFIHHITHHFKYLKGTFDLENFTNNWKVNKAPVFIIKKMLCW